MDGLSQVQAVSEVQRASRIVPILPNAEVKPSARTANAQLQASAGRSFKDILTGTMQEAKELRFSKHASNRLSARDIALTSEQLQRVEKGVAKAWAKGIEDSLVLVDDVALIVNITSKTVVTAMGKEQDEDGIFTNIDGAVIV